MFEAFWDNTGPSNSADVMLEARTRDNGLRMNVEAFESVLWENVHRTLADEISAYNSLITAGYAEGGYKLGFSDGIKFIFDSLIYRKME